MQPRLRIGENTRQLEIQPHQSYQQEARSKFDSLATRLAETLDRHCAWSTFHQIECQARACGAPGKYARCGVSQAGESVLHGRLAYCPRRVNASMKQPQDQLTGELGGRVLQTDEKNTGVIAAGEGSRPICEVNVRDADRVPNTLEQLGYDIRLYH